MFRQRPRKLVRALVFLAVVIAVPLTVYALTPVPGALLGRLVIDSWSNVKQPADYDSIVPTVTVVRNVAVPVADAPEAKLDVYVPRSVTSPRPMILWIHGGAFIGGTKEDAGVFATMLAHGGYTVATLGYTRPPDARYPTPVRQADAALGYLREHAAEYHGDPTRLFVGGNSAGAQLASQTAAVETNPALATAMRLAPAVPPGSLRGALLYCGAYDLVTLKQIRAPYFHVALWTYTGYRDWLGFPAIDQLSTVHQITADYPPAFVTGGDADALTPQSHELAAALRQHGVPVTTEFWEGSGAKLGHDYQFDFTLPQARQTFQDTLRFLATRSQEAAR
ncbi:MAG TPA: alpha/beta hydrolase [Micromonosporaceae bacterium]